MGALASLRAGLCEVFFLRDAQRHVDAYGPERLEAIRTKQASARALLRASRRLADPAAAALLLDRALVDASDAVRECEGAEPPVAEVADPPELGAFAAAETERDRKERRTVDLLRAVEGRSPLELRALRYGRAMAVALAIAAVGWPFVRDRYLVHDVALHKHVITSPLKMSPPTGEELVDGHTHGTFGVHTADGRPFVTVDLDRVFSLRRVRIYNRGDGWFDDVLPLTLSISTDGIRWETVTTRTTHFDVWDVDLGARPGRFVRVSKDSGYIALNAIQVYARD